MVLLRNPHMAVVWGFLFAYLPILSAWVMACGGTLSYDCSVSLGSCTSPSDCFKSE
jgi:hypothetical protein